MRICLRCGHPPHSRLCGKITGVDGHSQVTACRCYQAVPEPEPVLDRDWETPGLSGLVIPMVCPECSALVPEHRIRDHELWHQDQ